MLDELDHQVSKLLDLLKGRAKVDVPCDGLTSSAGSAVICDAFRVQNSMRHLNDLSVCLLEDGRKEADLFHDV